MTEPARANAFAAAPPRKAPPIKKTKSFDCIEMKEHGSLSIFVDAKDMTLEEKVAHWHEQNVEFEAHLRHIRTGLPKTGD